MNVHLFGLPLSTHRRLKQESGGWQDAVPHPHRFRASPISATEYVPFTEGQIRDLAAAVADGFTHIVIPASRDWRVIQSRFQFDCRVHIARLWEPLRDITWELLRKRLRETTELDQLWLEKICPTGVRHALLLPPSIFSTTRKTEGFWGRCDSYSKEKILEAEKLLEIVENEHRRPDGRGGRSWIDGRRRQYSIDPSRHGLSDADRARRKAYRFCFEVPPRFHYDMTDAAGRPFTMQIDGRAQQVTHCNVTPWGNVW